MRLDRGFGAYWGAAELDGGQFGGGLEGTKHQGGGGDRPEGPEDTRPGTPKLPQSSSITFFNSKDLFAGRKGSALIDSHFKTTPSLRIFGDGRELSKK